jgi:hypothetical protein
MLRKFYARIEGLKNLSVEILTAPWAEWCINRVK